MTTKFDHLPKNTRQKRKAVMYPKGTTWKPGGEMVGWAFECDDCEHCSEAVDWITAANHKKYHSSYCVSREGQRIIKLYKTVKGRPTIKQCA